MRDLGKKVLSTVIKQEKNVEIIEKNIYKLSNDDEDVYKKYIYEIVNNILKGKKLPDILNDIKEKKLSWKNIHFAQLVKEEEEQDDFIINPIEIIEGIAECNKCGSKRVYSYSKQCRSGDEATSSFHQCLNCKAKWSYNG